jgi:hypothetical protein
VTTSQRDDLLRSAFLELGLAEPTGVQLEILSRLVDFYERRGVLRGMEALPLWEACACAGPCWKKLPLEYRPGLDPSDPWNGGIPLPWIGPSYRSHGVVVVGINLREASGLLIEYEIALEECGQIDVLRNGGYKPHDSWWAYRSSRTAAAVMRSLESADVLDDPDPRIVGEAIDRYARVQAVKCSPKDGWLSSRTQAMRDNCPSQYLRAELRLLEPRAIVLCGDEPWMALERVGDIDVTLDGPLAWRGRWQGADQSAEVFWVPHPSSYGKRWQLAHEALVRDLAVRPAGR